MKTLTEKQYREIFGFDRSYEVVMELEEGHVKEMFKGFVRFHVYDPIGKKLHSTHKKFMPDTTPIEYCKRIAREVAEMDDEIFRGDVLFPNVRLETRLLSCEEGIDPKTLQELGREFRNIEARWAQGRML